MHGSDDPRVDEAMVRGQGLVRSDGHWMTGDLTRAHGRDGLVARLARLPAVQRLIRDGGRQPDLVVDQERLEIFRGVDDLSQYGYPRVDPIRGMPIFHERLRRADPRVVHAVVPPEYLRQDEMAPYRPQYVSARRRMPMPEAWAILEASFPGIDHRYLRLLVAARGYAEGGTGQPPRIAVDGPSGAGKDGTATVAAALIGDEHRPVPFVDRVEHFHQQLFDAAQKAGLVSVPEIVKSASRDQDILTSLNSLLTFDRITQSECSTSVLWRSGRCPCWSSRISCFPGKCAATSNWVDGSSTCI